MALLKFLKGNYSNLSTAAINEGQVLICGDTGELFVDVAANKRVKIGDFVVIGTLSELQTIDAASVPTSRLYYVEDSNILARSNGSAWIQINKQKTLAELGGVAQSAYDTKVSALEKADADNATAIEDLKGYVGTIPEGYTETNVVAYINKKAEETLNAASGGSSESAASVLAALNTYKAENDPKVQANTDAIDAIEADYLKAVDKDELSSSITAEKERAEGIEAGLQTAVDAAKKAADASQADVDALEAKVGTVTEGKTVVQMISEAQAAATYDDTAVKDRISAIESDYLKGTDKTSLEASIAAAKKAGDDAQAAADAAQADIDAFLAAAEVGDAAIDTLKEIQDYIESDGAAATEMTNKISALGSRLDTLEAIDHSVYAKAADVTSSLSAQNTKIDANTEAIATLNGTGDGSVSKKISDAITGANLGQYAKQTDLDAATADIEALEADAHTHANKALLDTYTQTEANLADAVAQKHSHANATVLDGITDAKVKAWDSAQANAEAHADAAVSEAKTELTTAISAKANSADVYTKSQTYTQAEVNELLTWGEF